MREVPPNFDRATRGEHGEPIDVALARAQHAAYVRALRDLGLSVEVLRADEGSPDACFVEDQVVVVDGRALVTRSGHPGRRGEARALIPILERLGSSPVQMKAPATLDGGDVLCLGDALFVGRSSRTNEAGRMCLAEAFPHRRVVPVNLPAGVLHLKCVCSSPAPGMLVLAEGTVPASSFGNVRRCVRVPREEAWAANTVGVGGRVLVGAGYPATRAALAEAGLLPVPVDVSELRKADGSLTCLSVRVGP